MERKRLTPEARQRMEQADDPPQWAAVKAVRRVLDEGEEQMRRVLHAPNPMVDQEELLKVLARKTLQAVVSQVAMAGELERTPGADFDRPALRIHSKQGRHGPHA